MTPERYLEFAAVEIATSAQNRLLVSPDEISAGAVLLGAYTQAFEIGAIITGLALLRHQDALRAPHLEPRPRTPGDPSSFTFSARAALNGLGLTFTLRPGAALTRLEQQAAVATTALTRARAEGGLRAVGAETRAGAFAARWGAQHGAAGQAAQATVQGGKRLEKTWVRVFPRAEHRAWHDDLNGVTIPVEDRFTLTTPRHGTLKVLFPYDGDAPWSEWIYCGHSVRYNAPSGAEVSLWDGT